MSADLVRASGLSRRFDERMAVADLSFTLGAGEVLALLGPNGAGKTTTFRLLAGLLLPTAGTVTIAGEPLTRDTADAVRGRVGLLTEAPGLCGPADGAPQPVDVCRIARRRAPARAC